MANEVKSKLGRCVLRGHLTPQSASVQGGPKSSKLIENEALRRLIAVWRHEGWSPKLISSTLAAAFPGNPTLWVSHETNCQGLSVLTREGLVRAAATLNRWYRPTPLRASPANRLAKWLLAGYCLKRLTEPTARTGAQSNGGGQWKIPISTSVGVGIPLWGTHCFCVGGCVWAPRAVAWRPATAGGQHDRTHGCAKVDDRDDHDRDVDRRQGSFHEGFADLPEQLTTAGPSGNHTRDPARPQGVSDRVDLRP